MDVSPGKSYVPADAGAQAFTLFLVVFFSRGNVVYGRIMVATGLINFPDPYFQTRSTVRKLAGAAGFVEKELFGNRFSFALPLEKPAIT